LQLEPDAGREEFLRAAKNHVIAQAELHATYERKRAEELA